jgi:hypothetical protein
VTAVAEKGIAMVQTQQRRLAPEREEPRAPAGGCGGRVALVAALVAVIGLAIATLAVVLWPAGEGDDTTATTVPTARHGAVLYVSHPAKDGSVLQATVLRVAFARN